eukprot:gene19437-29953_t
MGRSGREKAADAERRRTTDSGPPPDLVLEPTSDEWKGTVVFLHGLGDTGRGWRDVCETLQEEGLGCIRFVLPTAERRPVTCNRGAVMPAWHDEMACDDLADETCAGIHDSNRRITRLIAEERGLLVEEGDTAPKV